MPVEGTKTVRQMCVCVCLTWFFMLAEAATAVKENADVYLGLFVCVCVIACWGAGR